MAGLTGDSITPVPITAVVGRPLGVVVVGGGICAVGVVAIETQCTSQLYNGKLPHVQATGSVAEHIVAGTSSVAVVLSIGTVR